LDRISQTNDSLAGVIELYHIEVREFMMLSLICDQKELGLDQLSRALGLGADTVVDCVEKMMSDGLLEFRSGKSLHIEGCRIQATPAGHLITRRILDHVG